MAVLVLLPAWVPEHPSCQAWREGLGRGGSGGGFIALVGGCASRDVGQEGVPWRS